MYNLHRGKGAQPAPPPHSRKKLSPEEEAKLKQQALFVQNLLTAFVEFKKLRKKFRHSLHGTMLKV